MDSEQAGMNDTNRIHPDGGIDVLDPPPTDIMDEETLEPARLAQNAPRLENSRSTPQSAGVGTCICLRLLLGPGFAAGNHGRSRAVEIDDL